MSHHLAAILVKTRPGLTPHGVLDEVERCWTARGAARDPGSPLGFEPLTLSATGRLGYSISPEAGGWIAVADSERYQADHGLARHLAEALGTKTIWYVLEGATDEGRSRAFDGTRRPAARKGYDAVERQIEACGCPHAFLLFQDLNSLQPDRRREFGVLGLKGVDFGAYDTGPAEKLAAETPVPADMEERQGQFAALIKAGDRETALAFLGAIQAPGELAEVVRSLAWTLRGEEAEDLALRLWREHLRDRELKQVAALGGILTLAAKRGDRSTYGEVLARIGEDPKEAGWTLGSAAGSLLNARFHGEALVLYDRALAYRVSDERRREHCAQALWALIGLNRRNPPDRAETLAWIDRCRPPAKKKDKHFVYYTAVLYGQLGEVGRALEQLRELKKLRWEDYSDLREDECFETLRGEPAFQELFRKRRPSR